MMDERNKLPICDYKQQLLDLVRSNNVLIVRGQTGSGKTTQVMAFNHIWSLRVDSISFPSGTAIHFGQLHRK